MKMKPYCILFVCFGMLMSIVSANSLDWTYQIGEGQCKGTRVVYEEIEKPAEPYTTKKTIYTWKGGNMYYISCIRVHNRMPYGENAAQARIIEGGVGQDGVKIELRSKNSKKLHFTVEIWGEEIASQPLIYQRISPVNEKTLYIGGQKYCTC